MDLTQLVAEVGEWSFNNFGSQESWKPLLGAVEEVGELAHAHLKKAQGIRTTEDHRAKQEDAVADILIYLADYCSIEKIDMGGVLDKTWREVSKRNWKKDPAKGGMKATKMLTIDTPEDNTPKPLFDVGQRVKVTNEPYTQMNHIADKFGYVNSVQYENSLEYVYDVWFTDFCKIVPERFLLPVKG